MSKPQYEILKYISEEELEKFPIVNVKKGKTFIQVDKQPIVKIYYILNGRVDIFSTSYNGREFLIDQLGKADFIGKFSQLRGVDFQCSVKAGTDVELLDMTTYLDKMWNADTELGRFFHFKTSERVYVMYKYSMLQMHFTYEEIFAYWILVTRNKKTNIVNDVKEIFSKMNVSDRQLYYILKKYKELGLIERDKNQLKILDIGEISRLAYNVCLFMDDL